MICSREREGVLVSKARGGDDEAFAELCTIVRPRLLNNISRYLPEGDIQQDLAQEAFISAYANLDKFNETCRFFTWITKIGINKALSYIRDQKTRMPIQDIEVTEMGQGFGYYDLVDLDTPESSQVEAECIKAVGRIITGFSKRDQELFYRRNRDLQELSEISEWYGQSVPVVSKRLTHLRNRVAKAI